MQKQFESVANPANGSAVAGASVQVNIAGGGAAVIYSDNSFTQRANPIITDANGYFEYYAADGRYDWVISGSGLTTRTVRDVLHEDPETDEEIAWTPSFVASTPGDLAIASYGLRQGVYRKIGKRVFVDFAISWNAGQMTYSTSAGNWRLTGLPIAPRSSVNVSTTIVAGGFTCTGSRTAIGVAVNGAFPTYMDVIQYSGNGTLASALPVSSIASGGIGYLAGQINFSI